MLVLVLSSSLSGLLKKQFIIKSLTALELNNRVVIL